ncbi:bublin coiled-coil protein [Brachyistius frenatus]|uniref:bublin coiled-coil protein n=1 Tax=Brachyistius frenatus TaxID=100188 RepID=UPI0037E89F45
MMSGPNGDPNISVDDGVINDDDEFEEEEYVEINSMLDQINSYLDDLEERNDSLNGKLHELLESNRQARLEFRAQLLGSQNQEEQRPAADGGDSSSSSSSSSSSPGKKDESA